ncbi:hypothetical protein GF343_03425 [Candidatus Woesearchaeota archaeon]|nr:hypothetical protein [Candidatus Woesearchaeota archaeon]
MAILDNLMSIYQSYPWVFDGIIICVLLGVLFRILFEKGKIGDEKQAKKLGGIFGFFLGIAMIGYMQYRGWTLFIDGGPWVFSIVIISLVLVLWAVMDGLLKHEHRSVTLPLAFVVATMLIYAFLNFVPSYMAGVGNLFGDSVWIWHLIMWCLMIFILFWALLGMMAGGMPKAGEGFWGAVGGAIKAPFKAAGWGLEGAGDIYDWWKDKRADRKRRAAAREKPADTPEETEKIDTDTDTDLADASEEAEKTDKALDAAKAISSALAKVLNEIRASANGARQFPAEFKPENYSNISKWLKAKQGELNSEKKSFDGIKLVEKLINAQEALQKAKADVNAELQKIGTYTKINEAITKIGQISDDNPEKARLLADAQAEQKHLAQIVSGLQAVIKPFEDAINEILKKEELAQTKSKIEELDNHITALQALLPAVIKDLAELGKEIPEEAKKPLQDKIKPNCDKIITSATNAIETLGTLNKVIIDGRLKQGVIAAEAAITRFIESKKIYIKDFVQLQADVDALLARINQILSKQMSPKEKTTMVTALDNIKNTIATQKNELLTLITEAEKFIKAIKKAWEIQTETKRKMETDIAITEKKTTEELIKQQEEEARAQITAAIEAAKKEQTDTVKILTAGAATVKKAKSELVTARNMLSQLVQKTAGKRRKNAEILLKNLNYMLEEEEEIQKGLNFLRDYEKYIIDTVLARTELPKTKRKIGSVIYELRNKIIKPLKEIVQMLDEELIFLTKEEKELTAEPISPPPPSGAATRPIEMPVPPPPA